MGRSLLLTGKINRLWVFLEWVIPEELKHHWPYLGCRPGSQNLPQSVSAAIDAELAGNLRLKQTKFKPASAEVIADVT